MFYQLHNSRRGLMAALSAVLTSVLIIGLVSPSNGGTWADYAIPETGIVVLQAGNTGYAITPSCQSRLVVTHADGSQGSHTLNTTRETFSDIGLSGCYTGLGNVRSSDTFSWWSATGTTPAEVMPIIELNNVIATPGNKTIGLSWTPSNNAEWIDRYWIYFERASVGGFYAKMVSGNELSTTLNVVANSDDWNIRIVPMLRLDGRAMEYTLQAAANVIPLAPAIVTLQPADKALSLFFEPGIGDPAKIASYTVRVTPGDAEYTTTSKSLTIKTGIQNNVSYQVSVRANNAVGSGEWTDSNQVTTRATPKLATNVTATAVGDRGARISWAAAAGDATAYRITSATTGETKIVSARQNSVLFDDVVGNRGRSSINTFSVVTVNDYLSTTTAASVTTSFLPNPATAVSVTGAKNEAAVEWSAPADIETDIVKYTVELIGAGNSILATQETTQPSALFANLTSGDRVRARVYVHTAWGRSAGSSQSNSALVQGVPSAPANALVRQVTNTSPAISVELGSVLANGCAVTSWSATATWTTMSGALASQELVSSDLSSALVFEAVRVGTNYEVAVTATNCWGASSSANFAITPQALPAPVSDVQLTLSDTGELIATWTRSASTDVSSVLVTLNPGNYSYRVSPSTTRVLFGNLPLGQNYQATVTARNAAGNSESIVSDEVFAATAPGQVTDLAIVVDESTAVASVSWSAPSYTGAEITGYRIWVDGQDPQDITDLAVDIEGLVAGSIYSFTIAALSDLGIGAATTTSFGIADDSVIEESEPGVVVIWSMPSSLRAVKNVVVEKKVGTKWKAVATVKAKTGKYAIAKAKTTDVYRVKAVVSKKKQVALKIKIVRKK
jgi:hypothetical protein